MTEKTIVRGKAKQTFAHGAHVYHKGSVRNFNPQDFDELSKAGFLEESKAAITELDGSKLQAEEADADAGADATTNSDPPISGAKDKGNAPQNKGK